MGEAVRALARAVAALAAVAFPCAAQQPHSAFVGVWHGLVVPDASYGVVGDPALAPTMLEPREFRIRVARDGEVDVRTQLAGRSWVSLPWTFTLFASGDAAVIMGQQRSAYWVESVSFNVTKVDDGTISLYWWRVVNNTQIHPDDSASKFAVGGYGELRRLGRAR